MKRIFAILAVMALLSIAVSSFIPVPSQAVIMVSPDARVKSSVWVGIDGVTPSAGSAITSDNRIVGYQINGSSSPVAGLYDSATLVGASSSNIFDEAACASNTNQVVWYPAPKTLTNGLVVVTNASTTTIVVFYE